MRESHFIKQNQEKWASFEQIIEDTHKDPDKLHDVFIQITDDLSHARTFYPSRSVRAYLNGVAQTIFTDIYKRKSTPLSKIRFFFLDDLPQVIYQSRWSFFWALVFFIISFVIGFFSSKMEPEFLRTILGDGYVDMTIENIKKGDPMAVYKSSGRFDMTFGIMANNIRVTLMYFILGILTGVGSVAMMMYNGIMLGSFLQFFEQNNLSWEANLTVWMHGVLEISAIVIGTAAGITMGRGLLFPGTYTRLQAFQISARRGIKIMVGVVVMLVIAALIEGNLTRHTELGNARLGFIITCLAAVLFYYAWYPFYKAKKGFKKPVKDAQIPPDRFTSIEYFKIKNAGEIFGDTFLFFKRHLNKYLWLSAILAAVYCAVGFISAGKEPDEVFKVETGFFEQWQIIRQFIVNDALPYLWLINGLITSVIAFFTYRLILQGERPIPRDRRTQISSFVRFAAVSCIIAYSLAQDITWATTFFLFLMPLFGLLYYLMYRDDMTIFNAFKHTWWLASSHRMLTAGTHYIMLLISYLFFSFFNSAIVFIYLLFIGWNLTFMSEAHLSQVAVILMTFMAVFSIFLNFSLYSTAVGFLYYALLEINEANNLIEKIKKIGMSKKIQGLARE